QVPFEINLERKIFLLENIRRANRRQDLGEIALGRFELALAQGPVLARRIDRGRAGLLQQGKSGVRATVYEFGAEFDGNRQSRLLVRPDAPTDALARFDDEPRSTGLRE